MRFTYLIIFSVLCVAVWAGEKESRKSVNSDKSVEVVKTKDVKETLKNGKKTDMERFFKLMDGLKECYKSNCCAEEQEDDCKKTKGKGKSDKQSKRSKRDSKSEKKKSKKSKSKESKKRDE